MNRGGAGELPRDGQHAARLARGPRSTPSARRQRCKEIRGRCLAREGALPKFSPAPGAGAPGGGGGWGGGGGGGGRGGGPSTSSRAPQAVGGAPPRAKKRGARLFPPRGAHAPD